MEELNDGNILAWIAFTLSLINYLSTILHMFKFRIFTLMFFSSAMLYAQSNRAIYKNLIKNNRSIYDIKDSTLLFQYTSYNSFKNDSTNFVSCFLLNSNIQGSHSYIISSKFCINTIDNTHIVSYTKKWNNKDSPALIDPYNLDIRRPSSLFYPFDVIPTVNNEGFKKRTYKTPKLEIHNDTIILIQEYKRLHRLRKLYFKKDYKIIKIEEFNYNVDEPDAYVGITISYFASNCFDSLNMRNELGFYTPLDNKLYNQNIIPKDTINFSSTVLQTISDSAIRIDKNKFYLLDYWYLSCSPCLKMMPFLNNLHSRIDTSKIYILGINEVDKEINIKRFLEKRKYHFVQVNCSKNVFPFNINAFPTLILLDGNLKEIKRFVGFESGYSEKEILNYLRGLGLLLY